MIGAAAERVGAVEDKLSALTMDRDKMAGQLTSLERRVTSTVNRAKTQAQNITSQMEQRIKVALDQELEAVHARLGKIESTQEADRMRDAALQTDLSQMRQEMASLREEANRQIEDVRQDGTRGLSDLNQRLVANFAAYKDDLDGLSNRLGH